MRTNLNITDIAPRGAQAGDIRSESPWIKSPEFLKCDESEWPIDDVPISTSQTEEAEMKEKVLKVKQVLTQPLVDPAVYSSWIKLLRVSAWIRRFCHNVLNKQ